MDDRERIDRLEWHLARLELEIHELKGEAQPVSAPYRTEPTTTTAAAPESSAAPTAGRRGGKDLEAWFGENALLVVGVLALVATVGFALRYAFEQGWISPALRVLTGLAIGLVVAGYGERVQRRGLNKFGAAALGAGAAIAYLAVWAAAGPYAFVSAGVGIAALAVLSGLVLASAWRSDEPYVAAIAATGAYLAPLMLGQAAASADLLLGYTALVSVAAATVAVLRGWRLTFGIILLGFFLAAATAAGDANWAWLALYLGAGGAAAVKVTRTLGWTGHEISAWVTAWSGLLFGALSVDGSGGWAYVVVPALLVAPGWFEAYGGQGSGLGYRRGLLAASALLWTVMISMALPAPADGNPLIVVGIIAMLYLVPGMSRRIPDLLAVGFGVLALGVLAQWTTTDVTLGWAALVVIAGFATRREPLSVVRWTAVALGALAAWRLVAVDLLTRPDTDLAFVGTWALALYGVVVSLLLLVGRQWREVERQFTVFEGISLLVVTWIMAGVLILVGGTTEIHLAFAQSAIRGSNLTILAGELAVSAFWLLYAGALLAYGFRTDRRAVRIAGLVAASLAIGKVVFYDLARLESLYRVASFALLAVIALLGAYAYHRRARNKAMDGPDDQTGDEPE